MAWVEPGLFNLDLGMALRGTGFTYAGSLVAAGVLDRRQRRTNAGGPHCPLYGVTSAPMLALDVVLSDGTVARLGAEGPEAAGYDLRGAVVGAEGTLGLVAAVCVRLTPEPPAIRTMLLTSRWSRTVRRPCPRSSRAASCRPRSR